MASINDLATAASAVSAALAPSANTTTPQSQSGPSTTTTTTQNAGPEPDVARGALIVVEGLDRSGKTTQVKLLEQRFVEMGKRVKVMRFPGMLTF